ncbi:MAG TPA: response regulator [Holophagaceae bacterium]|nr:response regulator [Holophagaceae bacterium]
MARVTILDDSRLARTFAAGALRAKGIQVTELEPESLPQVMEALRLELPDLLLVDLLMPTCPGLAVVRKIRQEEDLKHLKIVVLSAHRDEAQVEQLEKLGVQGFLPKPVDANAVGYLVKMVLDQE